MTPADLLQRLRADGIRIVAEGAELVLRGPRGRLKPDLLDEVRRHKPDLLRLLGAEHEAVGLIRRVFGAVEVVGPVGMSGLTRPAPRGGQPTPAATTPTTDRGQGFGPKGVSGQGVGPKPLPPLTCENTVGEGVSGQTLELGPKPETSTTERELCDLFAPPPPTRDQLAAALARLAAHGRLRSKPPWELAADLAAHGGLAVSYRWLADELEAGPVHLDGGWVVKLGANPRGWPVVEVLAHGEGRS